MLQVAWRIGQSLEIGMRGHDKPGMPCGLNVDAGMPANVEGVFDCMHDLQRTQFFVMEDQVVLRFYEELNDFIPLERRKRGFLCPIKRGFTVGDLLKMQDIPLDLVDLVLVNGKSAAFSHPVSDGDHISVYPVFESFDIAPVSLARPEPLRRTRFVAGSGLKRLCELLRLMGFDTRIEENLTLDELVAVAEQEHRILFDT